nr:hypothetical protein [Leptospira sarikeiensis]
MLKGILVEKKDSKLILKTELGFVELDTSKVASYNGDIVETPPTIPDRYIDSDGRTGTWRMGISTLGYASLGTWQQAFPLTYGGGLFLEKSSIVPGRFYGLNSDFTYGRGKAGQLSIWSQSIYLGKSYGSSSPYWILGIGASSISRSDGDDVRSTITPDTSIEFGWAWETNSKHLIRAGIRSQCHWDSGSTLCQSGIRFSWGFQI